MAVGSGGTGFPEALIDHRQQGIRFAIGGGRGSRVEACYRCLIECMGEASIDECGVRRRKGLP